MPVTALKLTNPTPTRRRSGPVSVRRSQSHARVHAWRRARGRLGAVEHRSLSPRMLRAARARGRLQAPELAPQGLRSTVGDQLVGWVALALLWARPGVLGRLVDWGRLLVGPHGGPVNERTVRRAVREAEDKGLIVVSHRFVPTSARTHRQRASLFEPGPALRELLGFPAAPAAERERCPPSGKEPPESSSRSGGSFPKIFSPKGGQLDGPAAQTPPASSGYAGQRPAGAAQGLPRSSSETSTSKKSFEGGFARRAEGAAGPVTVAELEELRAAARSWLSRAGRPGPSSSGPPAAVQSAEVDDGR